MENIFQIDLIQAVHIIKESASYIKLLENWETLSIELKIKVDDAASIKAETQDNKNYSNVVHKLLTSWRAKEGTSATLPKLCNALEKVGLYDISENLSKLSLQLDTQQKISKRPDNNNIPVRPHYYITRSIVSLACLNGKVFSQPIPDIFLFTGMERYQISMLAGSNRMDLSINQIDDITVRFISLQDEEHFDKICQIAQDPVHWIRYRSGSYNLVKSNGSVESIQPYFQNDDLCAFEEDEFVNKLAKFNSKPVCLFDTPGMGKSMLLASIARKLKDKFPDRIVVFFQLQELLQELSRNADDIIQAFWNKLEWNPSSSIHNQLEIFLDGYDEVLSSQKIMSDRFLEDLKQFQQVRLHISSRLHMKKSLQIMFGVPGFCILPFDEANIISFLTSYWLSEHKAQDSDKLVEFSQRCYSYIKSVLDTSQEKDFAQVPLQCSLLADIYAEQAKIYSKGEVIEIRVDSIFEIFRRGIQIKLEKAERSWKNTIKNKKNLRDDLIKIHAYEAMKLIFPDWLETAGCLTKPESIKSEHLYAAGLMEISASCSSPHFVHRTFAEYMIAQYLVMEMSTCMKCANLLFHTILNKVSGFRIRSSQFYEARMKETGFNFHYNVICFFIDSQIRKYNIKEQVAAKVKVTIPRRITEAITACCVNDHCNLFELLWSIGKFELFEPTKIYKLALTTAYVCQKVEMLEKIIDKALYITNTGDIIELSKLMKDEYKVSITLLHVAVHRGNFPITQYLLSRVIVSGNLKYFRFLLYNCCANSISDGRETIQDKIQIIKQIIQTRKETLEEKHFEFKETPLLTVYNHIDLQKCLINEGADVNYIDKTGSTVLDEINQSFTYQIGTGGDVSQSNYTDLLKLLVEKGYKNFYRVNQGQGWIKVSNLVRAVEVEMEAFKILIGNGVDLNSFNEHGYSILYNAITDVTRISYLETLLQVGCNPKCSRGGTNVLHRAAERRNLEILQFLMSNRICNLNDFDEKGNTLLYYMIDSRTEASFLKKLIKDGCSTLCTISGTNALHLAVIHGNLEVVKFLVDNNLCNLNDINEDGYTASELCIKFKIRSRKAIKAFLAKHSEN